MNRIPGLDGWRGVAILLVLADHCQYPLLGRPHIPTGLHGVTLFFVLSGYLITSKLVAEKRCKGRIQLQAFYHRRIVRLVPAAWAYLFLLLTVRLVGKVPAHIENCLAAALFFRNYLDPRGLTGHFWSLAVEGQFYLAWPLVLAPTKLRTAAVIAAAAALLSAAWTFLGWTPLFPHSGWPACHTEFHLNALLVGCLAAFLQPSLKVLLRSWMTWPLLTVLLYLILSAAEPVPFLEPLVIAMLLVITSRKPTLVLDSVPLRALGAISYSLYLYQQPFFMDRVSSIAEFAEHVAICFLCALLSWRFLEFHARRSNSVPPLAQIGEESYA